MIDLYVNNTKVGSYMNLPNEWEWNLEQEIKIDYYITIYKFMYYLREYGDFFTLYAYEDSEKMISKLYIIDSRDIDYEIENGIKNNSKIKEFNAVEVTEDIEWRDYAIKMILED